jgi:hypothetical protein
MDGSGGQSVSNNERIIELIAERLEVGQKKYNQDMRLRDGRDMIQETLEELLDACVYITTELLKLEEKVGRYSNNDYMRDY